MGSSRGIRAGRAFVELFADDTKLVRGLRGAQRKLQSFGSALRLIGRGAVTAGFGAAISGPMLLTLKTASDLQEGLNKFRAVFGEQANAAEKFAQTLSKTVGRSVIDVRDSMSSFQAMFLGLKFEPTKALEMSKAMQKLALDFGSFFNLEDADAYRRFISGLSGSSEVFDMFGINIKAAALNEQLLEMGIQETTATATEQQKVLARIGIITESMTAQGAVGDAVKTAGSFANQMKRMRGAIKDTAAAIGSALIPVLTPMVKRVASIVTTFAQWLKQNKELVSTIFKIGAAIAAAGAAMFALGGLLAGVGLAIGGIITAITAFGAVLGMIGTALAALLTPIGAVVAAVVGLGGYLVYVSGLGGKALDWLMGRFQALKEDAIAAWKGIGDALASGNIGLAARILWLTLKMEWQKGVLALKKYWLDFKQSFLTIASEAFYGAVSLLVNAWAGMRKAWVATTAFMADAWNVMLAGLQTGWNKAQNLISKGVLHVMALFDDDLDVEAASKILDQQLARKQNAVQDRLNKQIGKSDRQRRSRLSDIEVDRSGTQAVLDQMAASRGAEIEKDAAASLDASKKALAKARAEWKAAIAEAGQSGIDQALKGPAGKKALDLTLGAGGALGAVAKRQIELSTLGTFNPLAKLGASSGNPAQRTAAATEKTANNTKRIREKVEQDGGNVFA